MTASEIGKLIRSERRATGWSQEQLAKKSGYRQATVSELERGASGVRLHTLLDIAGALNLELQLVEKTAPELESGDTSVDEALAKLIVRLLKT